MTALAAAAPRSSAEGEPAFAASARAALAARANEGPAWFEARRAGAARFFESRGLPSSRDEAYRFSPVRDVARGAFGRVPTAGLVRTHAGGSGLVVGSLRELAARESSRLEAHFGEGGAPWNGFHALAIALAADPFVVLAERGARATLHLRHADAEGGPGALSVPRLLVLAESGSELSLVERYEDADGPGERVTLPSTEVSVADGARVEHVRVLASGGASRSLGTLAVRTARDARYASRVFTFGGAWSRLDHRVALTGPGSECVLDGLYLGSDSAFVDHQTTIEHLCPHATSRERYKGVLAGRAQAVFDGTIVVHPGAVKTEAHQETRNLLLSADAVVHAKPHLRIDVDDVKCSHGATVGRLDPAQLFYLRSRGMSTETARAILTVAFAREIVDAVPDEAVRAALVERLAGAFPGGTLEGGALE